MSVIASLRKVRRTAAVLALGIVAAQAAHAEYPDRPIKYVLSSGAGSGPDSLMRLVLAEAGKHLGATFVIENRSGGGGIIALQAIANAAPDGYTVGHGNTQTLGINPSLSPAGKLEADRIQPIVQMGYTPNLLSVRNGLPVKSVSELITYAKAHPNKLVYGSAGNGTSGHVGTELFKNMAGIEMVHAPYKTAPAAVNDVMAGHVDVVFDNLAGSMSHAKNGKLQALAVTGPRRSALLPDLPTVSEAGLPGYEVVAWSGIIGPKALPPAIAQKINAAINKTLKEPSIIKGMHDLGYEIVGGTPEQFAAMVAKERAKWADVIRKSGAKTD